MERLEVEEAYAGDIVAVTGPEGVSIGDTIASSENPIPLPSIEIDEPTVRMTFGVSTSPFMGKEGVNCTGRGLHERLTKELRTNVSLRVEPATTNTSGLEVGSTLRLTLVLNSLVSLS
jgi:GTP-binding protein